MCCEAEGNSLLPPAGQMSTSECGLGYHSKQTAVYLSVLVVYMYYQVESEHWSFIITRTNAQVESEH